jgi:crossover junction endodeoxyribonuclease RuvC
MTFRVTIGCDPGQSGALAILADGVPAGFIDMPTMARTNGGGEEVNGAELAARVRGLFLQHQGAHFFAVVEAVAAMPGQGGSGMFRFGESFGILKGVLASLGVGYTLVRPQKWKGYFGLTGKAETSQEKAALKDKARTMALQRFPQLAIELARKKDVGRADALMLALYAVETEQAALQVAA